MSGVNGQEKLQQPVKQPVPPERATIKLKVIPTDIIEKLLGKYIKQINDTYRQVQGDIPINKLESDDTNGNIEPRKRTIAEVNETFDNELELSKRLKYSNEQLPLYGFSPTEISFKPTRSNQPISSVLKLPVFEMMKTSIRYNYKEEREICISKDTLALMNEWAEQFLLLITKRLVRLMEIQRRRLPNRDDLKLLLREGYINNEGLNEMYILSQHYFKTEQNKLNEVGTKAQLAVSAFAGTDGGIFNNTAANDDNLVMEEPWWIDQLVHRKKRKSYIPEWMPPLPPDYTYKSTPKYSQRITNPVLLREKLVQEGRLGEKALDHIIIKKDDNTLASPLLEDESITSSEDETNEEKDGVEKISSIINSKSEHVTHISTLTNTTENDIPTNELTANIDLMEQKESNQNQTGDDLVELAKKRMAILEKRRKEEEQRYLSRVESDESKFGRNFGFYTKVKKLPESINDVLNEYRENKFKHLICSLYKQEKKNAQWAMEQEELRKKIAEEKSKYAEANEIQLGVGSYNANDANSGFLYGNDGEEVDFDVDFSDMEEVGDIQQNESPQALPKPTENELEESREVNDIPLLSAVSAPPKTGNEATFPVTSSTYATNNENFNNTNSEDLQIPANSVAPVESQGNTGERILSVRFQDDVVDIPAFSNNDENARREEEEKEEEEEFNMEDFEEDEFEEL